MLVGVLAALLAMLGALAGVGAIAVATAPDAASEAIWIDGLRAESTVTAIQGVLDRRAAAVRARDEAAFMADVDPFDQDFVRRQEVLFHNLVSMPLSELSYVVEPNFSYAKAIPYRILFRFHARAYAPGVTVRYKVTGVDSKTVVTPWVPIIGQIGDQWVIADEASDKDLPYGANGQAWDAGPIAVTRSERVVAVFSAEDTARADYLLQLAEEGLDRVYAVRPTGWDGKVLVTAVQERRIFDAYFANAPDRIAQVAAIAVPYYDRVPDWYENGMFATTRVVFNPQQLSAQPEELAHDLAHEFVHAAMGPVTVGATPRWVVEGFAEYVAYKQEDVAASALKKAMRETTLPMSFPQDPSFYAETTNYITAWLACKMIAERYGEKRLIALYESFQGVKDQDANIRATLGVTLSVLTSQWRSYMQRKLR